MFISALFSGGIDARRALSLWFLSIIGLTTSGREPHAFWPTVKTKNKKPWSLVCVYNHNTQSCITFSALVWFTTFFVQFIPSLFRHQCKSFSFSFPLTFLWVFIHPRWMWCILTNWKLIDIIFWWVWYRLCWNISKWPCA